MPSPLRSLILAVPFVLAAMLTSAPVGTASAFASPIAFPMPFRNADYEGHIAHATRYNIAKRSHLHVPVNHTKTAHPKHHVDAVNESSSRHAHTRSPVDNALRAFRRDMGVLLASLSRHRDDAMSNSQDLQNMASQSASQNQNDAVFQQNAAAKFSSLQSNTQGFGGLIGQLAADKGLANYDKMDEIETMLKDIVNANKDALSAVSTMIYNDPTLGPILGPTVYEIKCIIDDILNVTENVTDGLLNALAPSLQGLLGNANDMTCSSQLKVLGFCL